MRPRIVRLGQRYLIVVFGLTGVLLVACSTSVDPDSVPGSLIAENPTPTQQPTTIPSVATPSHLIVGEVASDPESENSGVTEIMTSDPFAGEWDDEETVQVWNWLKTRNWQTDFRYRTVHLGDFESPSYRDRILPIDEPEFSRVATAPDYMNPAEPVLSLVVNGRARAYPLAILMWHELVNDNIDGRAVTVTYCPLCNTAIVFDSSVDGVELSFGTTGILRNSDLVMWDRQTESWWQQITGAAIVGEYARTKATLEIITASIIPWERFVSDHPEGEVLNRLFDTEGKPVRPYESPPYAGYANSDRNPFAYPGDVDRTLLVTSRVLVLNTDEKAVVYPFEFLAENPVVNDVFDGADIVAVFDATTNSSFNTYDRTREIAGSAAAYSRVVDGKALTFEIRSEGLVDIETGSTWTPSGRAVSGPLIGEQLIPVAHGNHFWFAVVLFFPETEIRDSLDKLVGAAG